MKLFKKGNKKKQAYKILTNAIVEEIRANVELLKTIDGIEDRDAYNNIIKNIKVLSDALKEMERQKNSVDWSQILCTGIVAGVSLIECAISWKEEPFKVISSAARLFAIKPRSKF